MSQHCFGVSRVRLSKTDSKKANEIADRHGCDFIEVVLPGIGYQRWFAGPNRGFPFDDQMAKAVYADLKAAKVAGYVGDES